MEERAGADPFRFEVNGRRLFARPIRHNSRLRMEDRLGRRAPSIFAQSMRLSVCARIPAGHCVESWFRAASESVAQRQAGLRTCGQTAQRLHLPFRAGTPGLLLGKSGPEILVVTAGCRT